MAIQIAGTTVIDNSRNLTNIVNACVGACHNTYALTDASNNIYATDFKLTLSLTTCLGLSIQGGFLICKATSVGWIVAPRVTEVSRTWYLINDADTRAQAVTGCTGWFVPTLGQLNNPGYTCRTFWNSHSACIYWSSTALNATVSCAVNFTNGGPGYLPNSNTLCVRSFRCVAY